MSVAYMCVKQNGTAIEDYTGEEEKTKKGDSVEKMFLVQAFNHSVDIATNPQTGEVVDTPNMRQVSVTCNLNRGAVEINKYLTLAKRVEVTIHFFRMGQHGDDKETHHNWFSYTLKGARISSATVRSPMAMGGQATPDFMDISFTFEKITWEYHGKKSKMHTADWKKKSTGR